MAPENPFHKQHIGTHYTKSWALLSLEHGLEKNKFKSSDSCPCAAPLCPIGLLEALPASVFPWKEMQKGTLLCLAGIKGTIILEPLQFQRYYLKRPEVVPPLGCLYRRCQERCWPEATNQQLLLLCKAKVQEGTLVKQIEDKILRLLSKLICVLYLLGVWFHDKYGIKEIKGPSSSIYSELLYITWDPQIIS